jgi:methylated-DNA--[protein]-cysteine S-methyltransferase
MKGQNRIITGIYESPCGTLMLGSLADRLCLCDWHVGPEHNNRVNGRLCRMLDAELEEGSSPVIGSAITQLDEYFAGARREFDVPLLFTGTDFQQKVWNALLAIPYGQTVSYGDMARQIGRPGAVRAVANANGANAISIFVPCHRVIGSNGTLTGYAGGLEAKEFLLKLENAR